MNIPVYPSSLFPFSGEDLPLCAFDEAIIEIVNEANEKEMYFGLEYVGDSEISGLGTIVKLKSIVDRNKIGEMVVIVTGVSYFKVGVDVQSNKKYRLAEVSAVEFDDVTFSYEIIKMFKSYLKKQNNANYLKINSHLHLIDAMKALNMPSSDKFKFFVAPLDEK